MRSALGGILVLAALLVSGPARLAAEPTGSYLTFAPMVGYAMFDSELNYPTAPLKDGFHVGGRLGWQGNAFVGLEVAGGWSSTEEDGGIGSKVTYYHASGNIVLTVPQSAVGAPFFAIGGGYAQRNSDDAPDDIHFGTFDIAGGWLAWFSQGMGLRLEARNILNIPYLNRDAAHFNDVLFLGGLSFALGGSPPVDTDKDGVNDNKDRCPDTPAGCRVDSRGCPIDSDGDGVCDGVDQCADTPTGVRVDARGCPADSDADGVPDGTDQCADTPAGCRVDARGCPVDGDGDGVCDGVDQCADTPRGSQVDARGCPVVTDKDGDGVPDDKDQCPDTPSGLRVGADGCPIEVIERETELMDTGMIRLQNVNFETAKWDILPESRPILDTVGQVLLRWPELRIEVGGHADWRGSDAYNLDLSQKRVDSVLAYLLERFPALKREQFVTKGYGESRPIASNKTVEGMARNRRVEFVVQNKDVLKREVERRRLLKRGEGAPADTSR